MIVPVGPWNSEGVFFICTWRKGVLVFMDIFPQVTWHSLASL